MELSTWLLYLSVISILLISLGLSALLCISDDLKFGNKKSIPTVLGGATTIIGLGAI